MDGLGWSDEVDEAAVDVVDDSGDGELWREVWVGAKYVDVVADGYVRVVRVDLVEVARNDTEVASEQVGIVTEAGDSAVGVVEHHQVPVAPGLVTVGLCDESQHEHLLKKVWGDASCDVADDDRFSGVETEDVGGVHARVDAADHDRPQRRGDRTKAAEVGRGVVAIALQQLGDRTGGIRIDVGGRVIGHLALVCSGCVLIAAAGVTVDSRAGR